MSLTSVPSKILEHIFWSHVRDYPDRYNVVKSLQHGFREAHFWETSPLCRTCCIGVNSDAYKLSFFPRTINEWNTLPGDIAEAPSTDCFKHRLFSAALSEPRAASLELAPGCHWATWCHTPLGGLPKFHQSQKLSVYSVIHASDFNHDSLTCISPCLHICHYCLFILAVLAD